MSIPLFIVISYIVILFLISFWAEKRSRGGVDNFVLAGRQLTTPLVTVSIVGLAIGGASTIGVAEQAYRVGLSAGWYTAAWGIGAITMGLLVAKNTANCGSQPSPNCWPVITTERPWPSACSVESHPVGHHFAAVHRRRHHSPCPVA